MSEQAFTCDSSYSYCFDSLSSSLQNNCHLSSKNEWNLFFHYCGNNNNVLQQFSSGFVAIFQISVIKSYKGQTRTSCHISYSYPSISTERTDSPNPLKKGNTLWYQIGVWWASYPLFCVPVIVSWIGAIEDNVALLCTIFIQRDLHLVEQKCYYR